MEAAPGTPLPDAVVLAGGMGRRLGGVDKGHIMLGGQALAVRVAGVLRPHCARLWVAARADHAASYGSCGLDVLDDGPYAGAGPLAGVLAALRASQAQWVIAAPCDMPLLPADYAPRLILAMRHASTELLVASTGERRHFACAAWRTSLRGALAQYLASGGRRVEAFLDQVGYAAVNFSQPDGFLNINTPADLAQAQQHLHPPVPG